MSDAPNTSGPGADDGSRDDRRDDLGEPGMQHLLERWGRGATSPPVEPPSGLLERGERILRGEADAPSTARGATRLPWQRLAAAAVLLIAAVWMVWSSWPVPGPRIATIVLSTSERLTRDAEPSGTFRAGERIHVHFELDTEAWVAALMLDASGQLAIASSRPRRFEPGPNVMAFRLDDTVGQESFLLIASRREFEPDALDVAVARASEAVSRLGAATPHRDLVSEAVDRLGEPGWTIRTASFEHVR